jgi:regulator of RNase E activity RraA
VQAVAATPPPGCVLVVGGQNTSRTATIGGLMALDICNLRVAGLVTDGLVRDAQEIRQLGLPVWCRGVTPTASAKRGPSAIGGAVLIGGALVRDGDLVIADDDGVVIWAASDYQQLLGQAQAKLDSDNVRLARLRQDGGR